jgi:hypothetical protein
MVLKVDTGNRLARRETSAVVSNSIPDHSDQDENTSMTFRLTMSPEGWLTRELSASSWMLATY